MGTYEGRHRTVMLLTIKSRSTTVLTFVGAWGIEMRYLLFALCSVLAACSPHASEAVGCSNQLINSTISSDKRFVASLVRRDCGATTAYSNIVFLKEAGDADGKDGEWGEKVHVTQGEMPVGIEWNGIELKIKAPAEGKDVFLKRDDWAGVRIVYE